MAESKARITLKDVRASVKRMQTEGEKLVSDARRLQADLRKRAERAIEELDAQRTRILATLEERVTSVVETMVKTLNVATHRELENLRKRVADLERRLDALSKERAACPRRARTAARVSARRGGSPPSARGARSRAPRRRRPGGVRGRPTRAARHSA